MPMRSRVTAGEEQIAELRALSRSERRDEADRARAILLSLEGWTGEEIGAAFGVTADSVRHWRNWYATGGIEGLRAVVVPRPSGGRGFRVCPFAGGHLGGQVRDGPIGPTRRGRAEIDRRGAPPI